MARFKELKEEVVKILENYGFSVAVANGIRTHVDVIARKKDKRVAIKIVQNVDAITSQEANELNDIALFMQHIPVIVGKTSKNGLLKSNVSYSRFDIPCIPASGLLDFIDSNVEFLASKAVGIKVMLDSSRLRSLRKLNSLTLKKLAERSGVSPSTIYKHEKQDSYASLQVANALEQALAANLKIPAYKYEQQKPKTGWLVKGVRAIVLSNAPFSMLGKGKNYYFVAIANDERSTRKKALFFNQINEQLEGHPFFIGKKQGRIEGIKVVAPDALKEVESEEELIEKVAD